jgi:pathogenesis-related protein 1
MDAVSWCGQGLRCARALCVLSALGMAACSALDAGDSGPRTSQMLPPGMGAVGGVSGAGAGPFVGQAGAPSNTVGAAGVSGVNDKLPGTGATAGAAGLGAGGMGGTAGVMGTAARGGSSAAGAGGASGVGGRSGMGGVGGVGGSAGMGAAGTGGGGAMEMGRLAGITAAHNAIRAMVQTSTPLPPLTWSPTLAAYAQQWTDMLAMTCNPMHRSSADLQQKGYGENLAVFGSYPTPPMSTASEAVAGWAGEVSCWTFGKFMRGDACSSSCTAQMNSDGCGHYTQIVWRATTQVGCGVSTCTKSGEIMEIWICNYNPAGNYVGQNPY